MGYKYGNISDVKTGDIVECTYGGWEIHGTPKGSLHVANVINERLISIKDKYSSNSHYSISDFKLIITKPGVEAKVTDTVICVVKPTDREDIIQVGDISTVVEVYGDNSFNVDSDVNYWQEYTDFLVLCKEETTLSQVSCTPDGQSIGDDAQALQKERIMAKCKARDAFHIFFPEYKDGTVTSVDKTQYFYEDSVGVTGQNSIKNTDNHDKIYRINRTQTQGNNMASGIQITVNGKSIDLCKHEAAACLKPKTDLEKKLPFAMVVYSANGKYESIHYNKTRKGVKKRKITYLQKPENLGKTITLHEAFGEFTTAIPVVEVK